MNVKETEFVTDIWKYTSYPKLFLLIKDNYFCVSFYIFLNPVILHWAWFHDFKNHFRQNWWFWEKIHGFSTWLQISNPCGPYLSSSGRIFSLAYSNTELLFISAYLDIYSLKSVLLILAETEKIVGEIYLSPSCPISLLNKLHFNFGGHSEKYVTLFNLQ